MKQTKLDGQEETTMRTAFHTLAYVILAAAAAYLFGVLVCIVIFAGGNADATCEIAGWTAAAVAITFLLCVRKWDAGRAIAEAIDLAVFACCPWLWILSR